MCCLLRRPRTPSLATSPGSPTYSPASTASGWTPGRGGLRAGIRGRASSGVGWACRGSRPTSTGRNEGRDFVANVYAPLPMPHDMPGEWPANPTIKEMSVPSEFEALLLSRRDRARLLVLPRAGPMMPRREDTAGSKPAYNDLDILTVRVLRRSGIDIDVLHDEDERRTSAQFGADLVIALGLFITQAIAE